MSVPKLLHRIGGEAAIRAAFSIEHALVTSKATVTMSGTHIVVEGRFACKTSHAEVGHFIRWIGEDVRRGTFVNHQVIDVAEPFRRKKIAWNHYKKAFAFYRSIGVRLVSLNANELGPYVWPAFAFNFDKREWKHMLLVLEQTWNAAGYEVPFWPSTASELLYTTGPAGDQIGEQIIREVHARLGGGLKMNIDFRDKETIRALVGVKLLEDRS